MRVKLTKISDDVFDGDHPNGINTGFTIEGPLVKEPSIGERLYVKNRFRTSRVVTLPNKDGIFMTENSTYKIEYLEESKNK